MNRFKQFLRDFWVWLGDPIPEARNLDIRTDEGIRNLHADLIASGKSQLAADWTLHEKIMRDRIGLLYSELPSEESKSAYYEAWGILGLALGRAGGVK